MDPITLIVTALAAGAAAGLTDTAAQAVKDAYAGLKGLIARKYAVAAPAVAQLEAVPASVARRAVAEEDLGQTDAARDVEVLTQALALLIAIQERAPDAAGIIGVNLAGTINAGGNITIGGTTIQQFYQMAAAAPPAPPFQAPAPAADHVPRAEELKQIKDHLLDPKRQLLPNTVGLHGFGGSGKTILARLTCADPEVVTACAGGILWVALGKNPPDPRAIMADLVTALTGQCNGCATLNGAQTQLQAALSGRKVLLVVDDVWNAGHARALLEASAGCARLITTRNAFLVPSDATLIELKTMRPEDARALLGAGLPPGHEARLDALADRLGYWPVLLSLANRKTRYRIDKQNRTPDQALDDAENDLARKDVIAFDPKDPGPERDLAVTATVEASLELLGPDERRRYGELAIFPQDVPIPLARAKQLWSLTGGLDFDQTKELAEALDPLALLDYDGGSGVLRLHDVLGSYLYATLSDKAVLHGSLAALWTDRPAPGDDYAWRWLAYHRSMASQTSPQPQRHQLTESLVALVEDAGWQQAHEDALRDLPALQDALEQALDAAVADDDPLGIPLLVRAADTLVQFRREHQRAEPIFQLASEGDLAAARRRSELFDVDDHWRHALLLAVAWLAPGQAGDEARKLCDEVQAAMGPEPALHNLAAWVHTASWAAVPPPSFPFLVPPDKADAALIEQLIKRVGGWEYDREMIIARGLDPDAQDPDRPPQARSAAAPTRGIYHDTIHGDVTLPEGRTGPEQGIYPGTGPEQGIYQGTEQVTGDANTKAGRSTTRYLAELDGPYLMAYAAQYPDEGLAALESYLSIYGNYNYPEYRYSALWILLGYVTQYARTDGGGWVQEAVVRVLNAALGGPSVDFEQGLPIAVTALRAKGNGATARQALVNQARDLMDEAMRLKPGRDRQGSDIWAHHKRLMLANAQAVGWLLGDQGLAAQVLQAALGLADSGFAGFQAPACLALAEAFRVCRPKNRADIDQALEWAQHASHNVQDPSFCARMTARVNAMRRFWWPDFVVRERYRRLPDAAWLREFAALHIVGHKYVGRRPDALTLPDWATEIKTFADLERLYQRPVDDLLRLNGGDRPLKEGDEVAVPDPGFIPHLAARLAAELLAVADPTIEPAQALSWLRGLVPYAVRSPTALDAVLTRLVLAQGRWKPPADDTLAVALEAVLAKRKAAEQPGSTSELIAGPAHSRLPA